ncbi:MAG: molecular chaperone HtpG [Rikenellaceae bacterium]
MQTGKIGVTTENIFPIIKKFLYSEHDIFLRELVSNAVDASTKLRTLSNSGEFAGSIDDLKVEVKVDEEAKTIKIIDSGIGMSSDEVEKYINQIAFSGAEEFLEKYKNDSAAIIGHFGLGFYSSFMVAEKVEVETKSYRDGEKAVKWSCDGSTEYSLEEIEKSDRGTIITLYLAEDSVEFASKARIDELLNKYCKFLPIPIVSGTKEEWKDGKMEDTGEVNIVNDTNPLWTRTPSELIQEDYSTFYHDLYPGAEDPLFHIHLNVDYPFNLTGVLYFPKIRTNFEIQKNKIQLYCNQVFVTDSVEGIVPEFLTLLHGVIDSPDIPLNVSRSYLQSDSNVKKISSHITKKVADRLAEIFNSDRAEFENKWDDLKIFIQYGIVTNEKFADRAKSFTLVKSCEGKYFTLEEYNNLVKDNQTDKNGDTIYLYSNDTDKQHSFIESCKAKGYDVLEMNSPIDNHFISYAESKNEKTRFVRVDSDVVDKLIVKDTERVMALSTSQQDTLRPVFESQLPVDDKINYVISFEPLSEDETPVIITQNEFMRRMKDMSQMGGPYSFYGQMPESFNVVVNANHPLVIETLTQTEKEVGDKLKSTDGKIDSLAKQKTSLDQIIKDKEEDKLTDEEKNMRKELNEKLTSLKNDRSDILKEVGSNNGLVKQLIDLALLSNGMLKGENLTKFIKRSVEMIEK